MKLQVMGLHPGRGWLSRMLRSLGYCVQMSGRMPARTHSTSHAMKGAFLEGAAARPVRCRPMGAQINGPVSEAQALRCLLV